MAELNNAAILQAVYDYVDYSNLLNEDQSTEEYCNSQWDMDKVCSEMYKACMLAGGISPDKLNQDEFVDVLWHCEYRVVPFLVEYVHTLSTSGFVVVGQWDKETMPELYFEDKNFEVLAQRLLIDNRKYGDPLRLEHQDVNGVWDDVIVTSKGIIDITPDNHMDINRISARRSFVKAVFVQGDKERGVNIPCELVADTRKAI